MDLTEIYTMTFQVTQGYALAFLTFVLSLCTAIDTLEFVH